MNWLKAYNHEGTEKVYIDGQRRQISMAGREDWIINGFQFGSEKDVNQAKSEKLKIQKIQFLKLIVLRKNLILKLQKPIWKVEIVGGTVECLHLQRATVMTK